MVITSAMQASCHHLQALIVFSIQHKIMTFKLSSPCHLGILHKNMYMKNANSTSLWMSTNTTLGTVTNVFIGDKLQDIMTFKQLFCNKISTKTWQAAIACGTRSLLRSADMVICREEYSRSVKRSQGSGWQRPTRDHKVGVGLRWLGFCYHWVGYRYTYRMMHSIHLEIRYVP